MLLNRREGTIKDKTQSRLVSVAHSHSALAEKPGGVRLYLVDNGSWGEQPVAGRGLLEEKLQKAAWGQAL